MQGLPAGVVGLRATGEVTKLDYERVVLPLFDELRAEGDPIHLLFHFPDGFRSFSAGAAWEDTKLGLRHMRLLRRCAVVSDTTWLRTACSAMAIVMPTRLRVFEEDDLDEALDWLAAKGAGSSLTHRSLEDRGVLVLEPHDELHVEDFDRIASLVDPWIEQGDLAGIVIYAEEFPGWEDLAGMIGHLKFVRAHHRQVPRVALAVNGTMAKLGPALARHFVKAELRRFEYEDLDAAIAWVAGDDRGSPGEPLPRGEEQPVGH
ncbi:MAG: STAS/SEC14 domain-containing protein [Planctomycetota bacterium]|nr:STAS/SEC14 domain-containing protein [Planctomycetota bacterium]